MEKLTDILKVKIDELTDDNIPEYSYIPKPARSLPNISRIGEIVDLVKSIVFPGFFSNCTIGENTQEYYMGVAIEKLYSVLCEQISKGLCFFTETSSEKVDESSRKMAIEFIENLPEIKRLLATDVKAVTDGDPAASSYGEVIFCYPGIQAMVNYRIAHVLLKLGVPVLPRIITELAHSATGIDINPGAEIGEYFCIDHGTGVVIGETCIIGSHVRLYQGVTLGAKSFTLDEQGLPMNIPRHPIVEDNVIIYSNSTILGRITIGHDSVIGGNVWQAQSVPPYSRIIQKRAEPVIKETEE